MKRVKLGRQNKKAGPPHDQPGIPGRPSATYVSADAPKKWIRWAAIGLVILILIAAGVFIFAKNRSPSEPKETVTEEGVVLRQLSNEELFDQVNRLIFQEKYSSAEQLIEFQDNADSYELRLLLAATYTNQGAYQNTQRVLLNMEKQYPDDWQIAKQIGQTYEQLEDTPQAIEYYQKALKLVREAADVPVRDDEIFLLEQDINRLEGAG